ncbi:MAG: hypothetical protein SPI77_07815 [Corynebacterium sp.]|nr:hypothetical protein [Corynebacterium sp.]
MTRRLAHFGDTIFATTTADLAKRQDAGQQVINLGQDFPDEDGPTRMLEVAAREILAGNNQYAPARGVPEPGYCCLSRQQPIRPGARRAGTARSHRR